MILTLFYSSLVEAKHEDETSRRDDVVNALKQITQKRYMSDDCYSITLSKSQWFK